MLQNQMKKMISDLTAQASKIELYKEEIEYVKKHGLISDESKLVEVSSTSRFLGAYIERSDKESEELIAEEGSAFLNELIKYLKKNKNEFIYLESNWLEMIGVDAISFEVDDVFGTYDVMLGLKLQKKYQAAIKEFLNKELKGDEATYDLMFSQDGLWDVNFELNSVDGFNENMSFNEAFQLIYLFLFKLASAVEEGK